MNSRKLNVYAKLKMKAEKKRPAYLYTIKVKLNTTRQHKGSRSTAQLFLISILDGGVLLTPRFTPGEKTRYPLYRGLIGPQG
jgi:hypothetical protein